MADLDDFFAKKDRKKAKGKKFTTTEEIAKKLEETGKRLGKSKSKDKPLNPEGEETQQTEDGDEWKNFEEEKKDYTGLKIGNLTVNETLDAELDDEKGTEDNSSDGEFGEGGTKHSGPWKKAELPPPPPQPEVVEPPPPPPPTTSGSSYKPPHIRNSQTVAAASTRRPRRMNIAPDIHSEEYFPTLNSKQLQGIESSGPWGRRKRSEGTFEEVRNRGGGRPYGMPDTQGQAPKLSLGNKYGALSQDQS